MGRALGASESGSADAGVLDARDLPPAPPLAGLMAAGASFWPASSSSSEPSRLRLEEEERRLLVAAFCAELCASTQSGSSESDM